MSLLSTVWTASLPAGDGITTPLLVSTKPNSVFVGTNGYLYEIRLSDGSEMAVNNLVDHGHNDVHLAYYEPQNILAVGIYGYFVAVNINEPFETLWEISLPGCGYEGVNVLTAGAQIYASSNGYVFRIDAQNHKVVATNVLAGYGNHTVRLAVDDDKKLLLVGINGFVLGVDPSSLETKWATSLPGCGYSTVSVLGGRDAAYAGCNGHVYKLCLSSGDVQGRNDLAGTGEAEVRLALSGDRSLLLVGTNGFGVALCTNTLEYKYKTSLAGSRSKVTNVVPWQTTSAIFASNGSVFAVDLNGGLLAKSELERLGTGETTLTVDATPKLVVGLNGYAVKLSRGPGEPLREPGPWDETPNITEAKWRAPEDGTKLVRKDEPVHDPVKYVPKPPAEGNDDQHV